MKPPRSSQHSRPDASSDSPEGDFDPQLWDLLGQAEQPPTVSPFFARNVIREIRLAEAQKVEKAEAGLLGSLGALAKRWRMIVTGAGAAAIVTVAATLAITSSSQDQPAFSTATTASYDAEIIAQLDELLDDESIWLDSTVSAH